MEELRNLLKIINGEMEEGYRRINKYLYTTKFKNQLVIIVEDETEIIMDIKNNEVISADTCRYGSYEDLTESELEYYLMKYVTWMLEYEIKKQVDFSNIESCGDVDIAFKIIKSKLEDIKLFARKYKIEIKISSNCSRINISTKIDGYLHTITQVLYI